MDLKELYMVPLRRTRAQNVLTVPQGVGKVKHAKQIKCNHE